MKTSVLCAAVCLLFTVCHGAPTTLDTAESAAIAPQNDQEVIEIINLSNFGQSERDKRNINNLNVDMLRQLFPGLSQTFDRLVQEIISQSFRVIGRVVLQNAGSLTGLLGGGGGDGDDDSEGRSRVSVSLPTFPPDDDDEDEDEEDEDNTSNDSSTSTTTKTLTKRDVSDVEHTNEDNSLSGSESQNSEVRVKFDDQDTASSNNGPLPVEESLDDTDADRNKRFLPFGLGTVGGDQNGASAGGSGNFLFDIIRLVAGSGSGSGATEVGDEKANAPEVDVAKGADGYTEGVPGPITRLFVIANRGIANLIQDLILRLAQTSERIVNFKARLVTALI